MKIKNLISVLLTLVISITTFGQNSTAKDLIREGIAFHDAGQYKKAIKKYKKASRKYCFLLAFLLYIYFIISKNNCLR